ncbi:hypothetical protein RB195_015329 [Necator americanus]|uniref:Survival of motor neuron-related-splicing factor 30 n=1 Tax=Necator americanus TaxID=51031 RepID=A0ABR1E588_NECAM
MMTLDSEWHVNDSLLPDLFDGNPVPTDRKKLERKLCDSDIRDFALPCLSSCMTKDALAGPVVLQLTRYRNVSQPKVKEDFRSEGDIVRLSLTDGHTSISAILLDNIKGISADTPPGTKLLIATKVPVECGFVLLSASDVVIIGGRVEKLIEKWMIERHTGGEAERGGRSDSKAPKWVSFGKGKSAVEVTPKDFKANDALRATNKKDSEEQTSFDIQRQENIDAVEEGTVKAFTVPKIQLPVKTVQESTVPRKTRISAVSDRGHDRRMKKRRGRGREDSDDEEFARPSKPSTLFDFVATNVSEKTTEISEGQPPNHNYNSEGNRDHNSLQFSSNRRSFLGEKSNSGSERKWNPQKGTSSLTPKFNGRTMESKEQAAAINAAGEFAKDYGRNFVNERNSMPTQISHKFGGQSIVPYTSMKNMVPLTDDATQAFSNMRISNGPRNDAPNRTFPPPIQHFGRNQNTLPQWKVGDQCKAPWTDGSYYLATVVNLGPADMCVVRYNEYGNIMTVPQAVLLLV